MKCFYSSDRSYSCSNIENVGLASTQTEKQMTLKQALNQLQKERDLLQIADKQISDTSIKLHRAQTVFRNANECCKACKGLKSADNALQTANKAKSMAISARDTQAIQYTKDLQASLALRDSQQRI
jgi:hypothetical protein